MRRRLAQLGRRYLTPGKAHIAQQSRDGPHIRSVEVENRLKNCLVECTDEGHGPPRRIERLAHPGVKGGIVRANHYCPTRTQKIAGVP